MIINNKDQKKPLVHYFIAAESYKRVYDTLTKIILLVNSFFIITSLSVFSFGLYQLILSFISIARSLGVKFFDGLVAIDMRRYFNVKKPEFAKKLFWENALFKIVLTALTVSIIFIFSRFISNFYGEDIANLIRWASLLIIIYTFQSLSAIFLQSIVSFAQQSVPAFREVIKLLLIIGFLLFYQFTIVEVIIIHVLSEAVATLIIFAFVFIKKYRTTFAGIIAKKQPVFIGIIKKHGLRVLTINSLKEVLRDGPPWLIKFFINTEAVAFYSLSINLMSLLHGFLPLAGLKPILALKADENKKLQSMFKRGIKYMFWLGTILLVLGFIVVPPAVVLILPNYKPALPIFFIMALALPIFGIVKLLQAILAVLREYGILAMRLANEVLILGVGSAVLLPTIGVVGMGVVFVLRHIERTWFLYSRLVKNYPSYRVSIITFFKINKEDREFVLRILRYIFKSFKLFLASGGQKK